MALDMKSNYEGLEKGDEKELSALVTRGPIHKAPRILLYGVHGVGKSTLAAQAPAPVFIPTEDGASEIDCDKLPVARSRSDVMSALRMLARQKHSWQTVVIDSVDWLEDFVHIELRASYSDKELSFGKDSLRAVEAMTEVIDALHFLREKRAMNCILIAHSEIKRFDSPLSEPYDRYQPKLQARFSALLQEWADAVLFAAWDVVVRKEEVGFNREVRRGVSAGERILYTEERPGFYAKNRYGLPVEMPMKWEELESRIPFYQKQKDDAGKK